MELKRIDAELTICKISETADIDLSREFYFLGKTDEEISLVCKTADAPENALERSDGWKAFRVQGILDFSLVGILSEISAILAENEIGIFAVSTFNTDYILVRKGDFERALNALKEKGYRITS